MWPFSKPNILVARAAMALPVEAIEAGIWPLLPEATHWFDLDGAIDNHSYCSSLILWSATLVLGTEDPMPTTIRSRPFSRISQGVAWQR
jgi:hypothetical protein